MNWTALPILRRELRVASRRSATYWSRFRTALMAAAAAAVLLLWGGIRAITSSAQLGAEIFSTLSLLAFVWVLLGAGWVPSDSLSAEKREGTLGFLFLTDLKPYDVVLGKLAASSLTGVYALVALVPILAIPILCGGVTLADFARLVLVLLNTLFFALALAMLVSALCWQGRTAAGLTFSLLLAFGGLVPLAGVASAKMSGTPTIASYLALPSPVSGFLLAPATNYTSAPQLFWSSLGLTHTMGWLMLLACCRLLPRAFQDWPISWPRLRVREWYRRWLWGGPRRRARFRGRLLQVNPIFWLSSRQIRSVWHPWIFLVSLAAIVAISGWALRPFRPPPALVFWSAWVLHLFMKYWIAVEASHAFAADRDKGALELLLSTPLAVREILHGHALALRRVFLAPIIVVVTLEASLWMWCLSGPGQLYLWGMGDEKGLCVAAGGANLLVFTADLAALIWVGWWMGATSRNAGQGAARTLLRVLLAPSLLALASWLLLELSPLRLLFSGDPDDTAYPVALVVYLLSSLSLDIALLRSARLYVLTGLRSAAALRYAPGMPLGKGQVPDAASCAGDRRDPVQAAGAIS